MSTHLHPRRAFAPGRYRLDRFGRLYPEKETRIHAVAIVIVRAKMSRSVKFEPLPAASAANREASPLRTLARREKPTPVHVPQEFLPQTDEEEEAYQAFRASLRRRQIAREKAAPPSPTIDGKRLAAALRARASKPTRQEKKRPTEHAQTKEECPFCGIPGSRGCDHFLPYRAEV